MAAALFRSMGHAFLKDYFAGLAHSIYGLRILPFLDRAASKKTESAPESGGRSRAQSEPLTTLRMRRERLKLEQERTAAVNRSDKSTLPKETAPPPEHKASASKRILQCIGTNLLCMSIVWLILFLMNWTNSVNPSLEAADASFDHDHGLVTQYLRVFVRTISHAVGVFGLLPLFLITRIVDSIWFADIAGAAFRHQKREAVPPQFSEGIADFVFAWLLETVFLMQCICLNLLPIPYIFRALQILHLCLLYSLYSFEYGWFACGWDMGHRLRQVHKHWAYYLGFGTPLMLATDYVPSLLLSSHTSYSYYTPVLSGCLFGLLFPLFIVSSSQCTTVPSEWIPANQRYPPVEWFRPSLWAASKVSTYLNNQAAEKLLASSNRPRQQK